MQPECNSAACRVERFGCRGGARPRPRFPHREKGAVKAAPLHPTASFRLRPGQPLGSCTVIGDELWSVRNTPATVILSRAKDPRERTDVRRLRGSFTAFRMTLGGSRCSNMDRRTGSKTRSVDQQQPLEESRGEEHTRLTLTTYSRPEAGNPSTPRPRTPCRQTASRSRGDPSVDPGPFAGGPAGSPAPPATFCGRKSAVAAAAA